MYPLLSSTTGIRGQETEERIGGSTSLVWIRKSWRGVPVCELPSSQGLEGMAGVPVSELPSSLGQEVMAGVPVSELPRSQGQEGVVGRTYK